MSEPTGPDDPCRHLSYYVLDELGPGPHEHGCLECGLTWITVD